MRINVNRNELAAAVTWTGKALPNRSWDRLPVLDGMRVEVAGGTLTLAAFDFDTAATARVNGNDTEPGTILVNGKQLTGAVKAMPRSKTARCEITAPARQKLVITCDGVTSQITAMPLADYPQLPAMPAQVGTMDAEAFKRSFARVAVAAGTDDTLPILTHVLVTADPVDVEFAATDRYRLAVDSVDWAPAQVDGPGQAFAVPARTVATFTKALAGKITVHYAETAAGSTTGYGFAGFSDGTHEVIVHTLPDNNFPKAAKKFLISANPKLDVSARVNAQQLGDAVTRAGKQAGRNQAVRLTFASDLTVTVHNDDDQVASIQHVPASGYTNGEFTVGYNPGYLASLLAGVDGDAWVKLDAPAKPLHVIPVDRSDKFHALVMPIDLNR